MTQENKVAELMKPRYKVIAEDTSNTLNVGFVYDYRERDGGNTEKDWCKYFDKYPHLFKKLEWWEDRKPEEMPEYVKMMDGPVKGTVRKMSEFEFPYHFYYNFLPATQSDYDQYIKQNL